MGTLPNREAAGNTILGGGGAPGRIMSLHKNAKNLLDFMNPNIEGGKEAGPFSPHLPATYRNKRSYRIGI